MSVGVRVCVWFTVLFPIVSVATQESFRLSHVVWLRPYKRLWYYVNVHVYFSVRCLSVFNNRADSTVTLLSSKPVMLSLDV